MASMSRKVLCFLAVLFTFSAISSPTYADDQTVFGPKALKIKRWHIHLSFHKFRVDDPGDAVIIITKRTPNKKIRGGFVFFNRKFISIRNFLVGSDTVFEKEISLRSKNRMTVFLRGKRGASIGLKVEKKGLPSVNTAPVADAQSVTTAEDTPVAITLTGSDPDGDPLTYQVVSEPSNGTLTGTLPDRTYTPSANYNGLDSFTFKVNDGILDSQPATVTITVDPVNDPPVANEDTATTEEDTAVDIDVLANDTDVDGDALEVDSVTVPANGSVTINSDNTVTYTPDQDFCGTDSFTYTVSDGKAGTATANVSIEVIPISPIALVITSPADGDTISRPDIMVEGTITNTTGNETGVTVNGILAVVYGDQLVANHVPLKEGENIITANATDTDGNTATASPTINALTTGDYITITADTESGISPLETTLRIEGSFSLTEEPSLSYNGPDVVEFFDSPDENEYNIRMTTEGIYKFTAEVDYQGDTYTDTIAIQVLDQAKLDALLRAKWEGMRQGLAESDIDSAVSCFSESSKENYREMFTILSSSLAQIEQELGDIQFIGVMKNSAEYDIRITRDGVEYSYYLLFVRDENGLWKIRSF